MHTYVHQFRVFNSALNVLITVITFKNYFVPQISKQNKTLKLPFLGFFSYGSVFPPPQKIFLRKIFVEDFISTAFFTSMLIKCLNCSSPVHDLCRDLPILEI